MQTQVETAGGGHPFVEVGGDLFGGRAEGIDIGGDDLAGGPAEEHRLDVVPLSRDRIDVVALPQALQDFVLARDERREVDEDDHRLTLDLPASHADADALVVDVLAPCLQQVGVLLEFGVHALVREVGTQQNIALSEFADGGLRLGRNDGVDAADFVAYLPTYLEQEVGGQFRIAHILL